MRRPARNAIRPSGVVARLSLVLIIASLLSSCSSVPRRLAPAQATLLELRVLESRPDGQLFALSLELVNPNPEEIPVVRLDFDIRLGGQGRLIGEHAIPFTLQGRGTETLEIEVFSELVSSPSRLMAVTEGPNNELPYEFHGELVLDAGLREPLPAFRRGQVPLIVAAGTP